MTKGIAMRVTLFLCAVVLTAACKGDKSQTAANAKAADPVFLLESGEERRSQLRYQIASSTKTESNMDFGFASLTTTRDAATLDVLPGVRLHFVAGPSVKTAVGNRRDEHVVESQAIITERVFEFQLTNTLIEIPAQSTS